MNREIDTIDLSSRIMGPKEISELCKMIFEIDDQDRVWFLMRVKVGNVKLEIRIFESDSLRTKKIKSVKAVMIYEDTSMNQSIFANEIEMSDNLKRWIDP